MSTDAVAYVDTEDENLFVYVGGRLRHQIELGYDTASLGSLLEDLGVEVRRSDDVFGDSAEGGTFEPLPTLEAIERWKREEPNRELVEAGRELEHARERREQIRRAFRANQENLRTVETEVMNLEAKLERARARR